MRVLITGATGMIGTALTNRLAGAGHDVIALTRRATRSSDIAWDPSTGRIDAGRLEGFDAVVHLAGESLAAGRWTPARKREFRSSRVGGTDLLARALAERTRKPRVLVSVSAVGIYGDRRDETLDESSPPGNDFLSELAVAWEAAATPAAAAGIRVVHPRIGLALSPAGGALRELLPSARLGLGGPLGSGRQWWSWVTLDDVVSALAAAIHDDRLRGPVNVVAPAPARQKQFARTLGRVLRRPAFVPAPAFALRILLGEMADAMLLGSQRVKSSALEAVGFRFRDPALEPALRRLLGCS